VVSSISSIPKVGKLNYRSTFDTTQVGRASFGPRRLVTLKWPQFPNQYRTGLYSILYMLIQKEVEQLYSYNISLYSFIILKSPISFNGETIIS